MFSLDSVPYVLVCSENIKYIFDIFYVFKLLVSHSVCIVDYMLFKDTSTLYNPHNMVGEVGEGNGAAVMSNRNANGVSMSNEGGCTSSVCVSVGDAGSLTKVEIREALVKVKRSEAKLACWKSELLAELNRRFSAVDAQQVAADELLLSNRDAKRVVDNATQLEKLPNTKQSLAAGDIDKKQADMITASSTQGPVDEKQLSDLAKTQNADDFGRSIREHQKQQDQKGGLSQFERQRKRRSINLFDDPVTGIKYWSHGGTTNLNNLALVCDRCHHKIHDQHWQVTQNQTTRKYQLIPPPKTPYQTRQRK